MFALMDLRCVECDRVSDDRARGWRTKLADDPDDPFDEPVLASYCPACAVREFGPLPYHGQRATS
jgi:hypothetical protein